jgi:hypothetical protein
MDKDIKQLFPESYEASRQDFLSNFEPIRALWSNAQQHRYPLPGSEELSIDWISADPEVAFDKLFVFTTGQHGIEAYVGEAILRKFIDKYLKELNPKKTGLLIVHCINPWGMVQNRRSNANNVDLNRNFVHDDKDLDPTLNQDYTELINLMRPEGAIENWYSSNLRFFIRLLLGVIRIGAVKLQEAALSGQYQYPKGIYYGGDKIQDVTRVLIDLYREKLRHYKRILHLDMHTGYGPRYQMSLVISSLEPRDSRELECLYGYPRIVKSNPEEFYMIRGDMLDYLYKFVQINFPDKKLSAMAFEFGTYGDSLWQGIRSLRAMIFENQLYWHGASNTTLRQRIERDFRELYIPDEEHWRVKAITDADQAFEGILHAEGFIT